MSKFMEHTSSGPWSVDVTLLCGGTWMVVKLGEALPYVGCNKWNENSLRFS